MRRKLRLLHSVSVEDNFLLAELLVFFMDQNFFCTVPLSMSPSFNKKNLLKDASPYLSRESPSLSSGSSSTISHAYGVRSLYLTTREHPLWASSGARCWGDGGK